MSGAQQAACLGPAGLTTNLEVPLMPDLSRRSLIRGAAAVSGVAAAAVTPKAAQAATRQARHGDIRDIKHVVILMQENRSFDHYFGSLKGCLLSALAVCRGSV